MTAATYDPARKHRLHSWFDTKRRKQKYGIQQHYPDLKVWAHAHYRGEMLIFNTQAEANKFIEASRAVS